MGEVTKEKEMIYRFVYMYSLVLKLKAKITTI